jgi:hypothetical protein
VVEWKQWWEWRSEAGRRGDELGTQSDLKESETDLLARPAQRLLLLLSLLGLLCHTPLLAAFLLLQVHGLSLDLPEGATRILIIASPWRRRILRAWHPDLMTANERENLSTSR